MSKTIIDLSDYNLKINFARQGRHIEDSEYYLEGRSILEANPQMLIDLYSGKGEMLFKNGAWLSRERFEHTDYIGVCKFLDGTSVRTKRGIIHYSKTKGLHVVPSQPKTEE